MRELIPGGLTHSPLREYITQRRDRKPKRHKQEKPCAILLECTLNNPIRDAVDQAAEKNCCRYHDQQNGKCDQQRVGNQYNLYKERHEQYCRKKLPAEKSETVNTYREKERIPDVVKPDIRYISQPALKIRVERSGVINDNPEENAKEYENELFSGYGITGFFKPVQIGYVF
ncbi:MAG: hypothetical protein JXA25_00195 [Anaerolineales bacterium]|nr:hypothetical protein [Anaerolineales bacterium]